jgi:hypothetical protein
MPTERRKNSSCDPFESNTSLLMISQLCKLEADAVKRPSADSTMRKRQLQCEEMLPV